MIVLLIVLLLVVLILSGFSCFLMLKMLEKQRQEAREERKELLDRHETVVKDLLNRIQAKDLQAFQVLTSASQPQVLPDVVNPDEEWMQALKAAAGAQGIEGLGEPEFLVDIMSGLEAMGVTVD